MDLSLSLSNVNQSLSNLKHLQTEQFKILSRERTQIFPRKLDKKMEFKILPDTLLAEGGRAGGEANEE